MLAINNSFLFKESANNPVPNATRLRRYKNGSKPTVRDRIRKELGELRHTRHREAIEARRGAFASVNFDFYWDEDEDQMQLQDINRILNQTWSADEDEFFRAIQAISRLIEEDRDLSSLEIDKCSLNNILVNAEKIVTREYTHLYHPLVNVFLFLAQNRLDDVKNHLDHRMALILGRFITSVSDQCLTNSAHRALAIFASQCTSLNSFLMANGYLDILTQTVNHQPDNSDQMKSASIALSSLLGSINDVSTLSGVLPAVERLFSLTDSMAQIHLLRGLTTAFKRQELATFLSKNINIGSIMQRAFQFLDSSDTEVLATALEFLSIAFLLISPEPSAIEPLIIKLKNFLEHSEAIVQFRATPIVKCLANSCPNFVQLFLTNGLIQSFNDLFYMADYRTQVEATDAALAIIQNSTLAELAELAHHGLLEAVENMLTFRDAQLLATALEVLLISINRLKATEFSYLASQILETTTTMDQIGKLSNHPNQIVAQKAWYIMDACEKMSGELETSTMSSSPTSPQITFQQNSGSQPMNFIW